MLVVLQFQVLGSKSDDWLGCDQKYLTNYKIIEFVFEKLALSLTDGNLFLFLSYFNQSWTATISAKVARQLDWSHLQFLICTLVITNDVIENGQWNEIKTFVGEFILPKSPTTVDGRGVNH